MYAQRKHVRANGPRLFAGQTEFPHGIGRGLFGMIEAVEPRVVVFPGVVDKAEVVEQTHLDGAVRVGAAARGKPGHADRDTDRVVVGICVNVTRIM